MRNRFLAVLATLIAFLLVLTLVSCTGQKSDDDDWMDREIDVDSAPRYVRPQQPVDDESAYQSGNRVELPTVPVD